MNKKTEDKAFEKEKDETDLWNTESVVYSHK